ncbi:hypothetical protein ACOMHN_053849 [Nucella lapillus]
MYFCPNSPNHGSLKCTVRLHSRCTCSALDDDQDRQQKSLETLRLAWAMSPVGQEPEEKSDSVAETRYDTVTSFSGSTIKDSKVL